MKKTIRVILIIVIGSVLLVVLLDIGIRRFDAIILTDGTIKYTVTLFGMPIHRSFDTKRNEKLIFEYKRLNLDPVEVNIPVRESMSGFRTYTSLAGSALSAQWNELVFRLDESSLSDAVKVEILSESGLSAKKYSNIKDMLLNDRRLNK